MIEQTFGFSLFLFLLATGFVVRQMWTTRSVGLGCAYLFQLWMFYAIGPCLHALPWSELPNKEPVFEGFAVSSYGAVAFAAGWCLRPMLLGVRRSRPVQHDQRIAKVYLMCGVFSFFVLQPLFGGLPSIASVVHAAGQLTLAGFCLGAFLGWHQRGWMQMLKWVIPSLLVPLVTVIAQLCRPIIMPDFSDFAGSKANFQRCIAGSRNSATIPNACASRETFSVTA